jgi:WD40 repeat protein
MRLRASSLFVVAATTMAFAVPADAQNLKQVATISIPGTPINQFGSLTIDQASGLGYLADKDNKGVVVFDTKTDTYVSRITGFVGVAKSGNTSGPNGIVVVNGGAEVWVSDGDSSITVIDTKSVTPKARIDTGGKSRANGMAFDPNSKVVIVANSNDAPPFLSLISTEPDHKIIAKIPVPESAENLERSAYHGPSGHILHAQRHDQGIARPDRPQERQAREVLRDRGLPPAQPVDRHRPDDFHGLQQRSWLDSEAGRRHGDFRHGDR